MSTELMHWRATETEKKFLDDIKKSWNLTSNSDAIHKVFELSIAMREVEKPAEARGGDNGTVPIEQQSPSSALPQQAQQPNSDSFMKPSRAEEEYIRQKQREEHEQRMTQIKLERERLITAERQKRLSPHRRLNNEEYIELMQRMNNAVPPPFKKKAPFSTRNNEGIGDGLPYS